MVVQRSGKTIKPPSLAAILMCDTLDGLCLYYSI